MQRHCSQTCKSLSFRVTENSSSVQLSVIYNTKANLWHQGDLNKIGG